MLLAGLVGIVFIGLLVYLLIIFAGAMPNALLKFLGYFLLIVSCIEVALLIWILTFIGISDWSLWGLSVNDFWKEQLYPVYFVKEWIYSWMWNDLLDFFLAFLPAVVFLVLRTTLTSVLGFWALAASKR
jgi:hypothetical protein